MACKVLVLFIPAEIGSNGEAAHVVMTQLKEAEMQFQAVAKVIANFGGRCYLMGDHHPLYKDSFTATRGMPDKQLIFTSRAGDFKFRRVLMRPAPGPQERNLYGSYPTGLAVGLLGSYSRVVLQRTLCHVLTVPDIVGRPRFSKKIRRVLSQEVNSWELPAILRCKRADDGSL